MLPSEYFSSLFSRQINSLFQFFNCKCHEGDVKNIKVSKKVLERSSGAGANDDFIHEVTEVVSASYREMRAWAAGFGQVLDSMAAEYEQQLVTPCGEQRRALEQCLNAYTQEPLHCYDLVTELMQCARDCALELDDEE